MFYNLEGTIHSYWECPTILWSVILSPVFRDEKTEAQVKMNYLPQILNSVSHRAGTWKEIKTTNSMLIYFTLMTHLWRQILLGSIRLKISAVVKSGFSIMTGNACKAVGAARMGRLNGPLPSPFLLIISMYRFWVFWMVSDRRIRSQGAVKTSQSTKLFSLKN